VDNAGSEMGFHHFCMYLAATPEMFDNPEYFPRYDALATRIQPLGQDINWRAPVVDLDRTPLDKTELYQMALKIREVHRVAYGDPAAKRLADGIVKAFVDEVSKSRFRIAKPRLLARLLVDELERARQQDTTWQPAVSITQSVQQTAEKILKETNV
jgi:hypothetical protein